MEHTKKRASLLLSSSIPAECMAELLRLSQESTYDEEVSVERMTISFENAVSVRVVDEVGNAVLCMFEDLELLQKMKISQMAVIVYLPENESGECLELPEGHFAEELMQVERDSVEMLLDPDLWVGGGLPSAERLSEANVDLSLVPNSATTEASQDDVAYNVVDNLVFLSSFKALDTWSGDAVLSLMTQTETRVLITKEFPNHKSINLQDNEEIPHEFLHVVKEGVSYIKQMVSEEKRLLVHCVAGVSRSAAMVCAYLMNTGRCDSVETGLSCIREARPWVQPNSDFMENLQMYESLLNEDPAKSERAKLLFDPCFKGPICSGKKCATTRLRPEGAVGDVLLAYGSDQFAGGGHAFAYIVITALDQSCTYATLTPELAATEGMTIEELQAALKKYYPDITDTTPVCAMYFSVILDIA